jgi:hypothetical protein
MKSRKLIPNNSLNNSNEIVFQRRSDKLFKMIISGFQVFLGQSDLKDEYIKKIQEELNYSPDFDYDIFKDKLINYVEIVLPRVLLIYENAINFTINKLSDKNNYKKLQYLIDYKIKGQKSVRELIGGKHDEPLKILSKIKDFYDDFFMKARNIKPIGINRSKIKLSDVGINDKKAFIISYSMGEFDRGMVNSTIIKNAGHFLFFRNIMAIIYLDIEIRRINGRRSKDEAIEEVMRDILKIISDTARESQGARVIEGNPNNLDPLIKKCRAQWDSYCERPGRRRLVAVYNTLNEMKDSKSSKVRSEMQRCLRVAKLERKRFA